MATEKNKKIDNSPAPSNSQIMYVEPNLIVSYKDKDALNGFEEAPKLENYSIYVNLQVEVKRRYSVSNENKYYSLSWTASDESVSFQQGSRIYFDEFKKDTNSEYVNAFTTDYADFAYEDRASNEDVPPTSEMFGIKSIDINYDNYYVPQVTIEFIDIRGISLFSPEEEAHNVTQDGISGTINPDYAGSFFKSFFTFPYPIFTLKVKGFYGKPISYELNCVDWKANFDCTLGNFGCTANFVGYSYALLSDITFNLLCAAPLTQKGSLYWKTKGGSIYSDTLSDTSSTSTEDVVDANNELKKSSDNDDPSNDKFTSVNKEEPLPTFKTILEEFKWATAQSDQYEQTSDSAKQLKESNRQNSVINDILNDLSALQNDFINGNESRVTGNGYTIIYGNGSQDHASQFSTNLQNIQNKYDFKNLNINAEAATCNFYADNNTFSTISNEIKNELSKINNVKKIEIFDYIDLYNQLNSKLVQNKNTIEEASADITKKQAEIYNSAIKLTPYVQNIIKLICAHIDTLLYLIEDTVKNVEKDKKTRFISQMNITESDCPKDDEVPPFPKITSSITESNSTKIQDGWIGDCLSASPEQELVENLLSASKILATIANKPATDNGNNEDINDSSVKSAYPCPVIPTDYFLTDSDNMFGNINIGETDKIFINLLYRFMNIIGTYHNSIIISDRNDNNGKKTLQDFAQSDAKNFFYKYKLNNSHFAKFIKGGINYDDYFNYFNSKNGDFKKRYKIKEKFGSSNDYIFWAIKKCYYKNFDINKQITQYQLYNKPDECISKNEAKETYKDIYNRVNNGKDNGKYKKHYINVIGKGYKKTFIDKSSENKVINLAYLLTDENNEIVDFEKFLINVAKNCFNDNTILDELPIVDNMYNNKKQCYAIYNIPAIIGLIWKCRNKEQTRYNKLNDYYDKISVLYYNLTTINGTKTKNTITKVKSNRHMPYEKDWEGTNVESLKIIEETEDYPLLINAINTLLGDRYILINYKQLDKKSPILIVPNDLFRSYFNMFIATLKGLYSPKSNTKEGSGEPSGEDSTTYEPTTKVGDLTQIKEAKIALYNYLKIIYDRWLAGSSDNELKKWHLAEFYGKRFIYIDSFYYKIGQKAIINPKDLYNRMLDSLKQESYNVVSFISEVLSNNNMTFLCIQNFADISKSEVIHSAFTQYSYEDIDNTPPQSDFICLYTYENSHNIGGNEEYEDTGNTKIGDSFLITGETQTTDLPLVITSKNENNGYRMPCFGVSFGKQYQSFFQNIQVNMDSPVVTEQVIKTQFSLGNTAGANKGLQCIGQDLFTIYSNNSYQCSVTMMGCGWVQPTMYFSLLNIPMFRGTYMIFKVSHHIEPGMFTTTFSGNRLSRIANPLVQNWLIGGDGLSSPNILQLKNQKADVTNNCPYEYNDPETMLLGAEAFFKKAEELIKYKSKIANMLQKECSGSDNKIDSALILTCLINRSLGTSWGKSWDKIFSGINPGDKNEFNTEATTSTINMVTEMLTERAILNIAKTSSELNGNIENLRYIDSWNGRDLKNKKSISFNKKLSSSSHCFIDKLKSGLEQLFSQASKDNKPYWNNDNNTNMKKNEKHLEKKAIGLWRAIKDTCDNTPSLENSNVSLESNYNAKYSFVIKCEKEGDKVFDMILLTYFKFLSNLYWVCKSSNNIKSAPSYLKIKVKQASNESLINVAFLDAINGKVVQNVTHDAISDSLKQTLKKAYKGENNAIDTQFKKGCCMLKKGELEKVVASITDCDDLINGSGAGFGNGGKCGNGTKFSTHPIVFIKTKYCPVGTTQNYEAKNYKITSGYMKKREKEIHSGIDISGDKNTYVYSIADGEVIMDVGNCDKNGHGYGHVIVIKHRGISDEYGNCLFSLYGHVASINGYFNKNTKVKAGEAIAKIANGQCGKSTGPHLHLSVYWDKKGSQNVPFCGWSDPKDYIK